MQKAFLASMAIRTVPRRVSAFTQRSSSRALGGQARWGADRRDSVAPQLTQDPQFGHAQNELPGCSACGWVQSGPGKEGNELSETGREKPTVVLVSCLPQRPTHQEASSPHQSRSGEETGGAAEEHGLSSSRHAGQFRLSLRASVSTGPTRGDPHPPQRGFTQPWSKRLV